MEENLKLTAPEFHDFVQSLLNMIEAKDYYTAGHSERVANLALKLAETMELPHPMIQQVHIAGHFHDIGKIGIPDGILLKSGKLTPPEFAVIQQHPVIGWKIIKDIPSLSGIAEIILCHHERIDGQGYPEGRKGDAIPRGARILAVADTFDALTTTRTYRKSMDLSEAINEIILNKEHQFDTRVVEALIKLYEREYNFFSETFKTNRREESSYASFKSVKQSRC